MISGRGLLTAMLTGQEVCVEDGKGLSPGGLSMTTSSLNTAGAALGSILCRAGNWLTGSGNVHASEHSEDKHNGTSSENQFGVAVESVPGIPQVCIHQYESKWYTNYFVKSHYPSAIINEWMLCEVCKFKCPLHCHT